MDSGEVLARVKLMRAVIPFFPVEETALTAIVMSVESMVESIEALDWLTRIAINVMTKWSLAELRGLYCTRYKPKDGIFVECSIPGFKPAEIRAQSERAYIERQSQEAAKEIAEWKKQRFIAGPEDPPINFKSQVKILARLKRIPAPKPEPASFERKPARSEEETQRQIQELEEKLKGTK